MRAWRVLSAARTALLVALFGAVVLYASRGSIAVAQSPSPGLDFSIGIDADGDGVDDCNTSSASTTCRLPLNATFAVSVYLNSLPDGALSYEGFDIVVEYFGVTSKDNPSFDPWPDCGIEAAFYGYTFLAFGCALGIRSPTSMHLGRIATTDFNCVASGTVRLVHGHGHTALYAPVEDPVWGTVVVPHYEASDSETLVIECGDPPVPPPPPDLHGDADCGGAVTSIDALLVLQFDARLIHSIPCPRNADVNKNGSINSLDAFLSLQIHAGLV